MEKKKLSSTILTLSVLALIACLCLRSAPARERDLSSSPLASERVSAARAANTGTLSVIAFGAHPDDCEIRAGGVAAMWVAQGHKAKFVSTTNGDIGHWKMAGGQLAKRRTAEVERAAEILGIETRVLDIHDGELMPTLENRRTFTRLIREANADIVMAHRPNDYHPDHRYTGVLMQDAAFMVICPFFCPDVPHLTRNPVFLYFSDRFQKPNPFEPDVVVSIDSVIEKKLDALVQLESQFVEGCVTGNESMIPKNEAERAAAHRRVRANFRRRFEATANKYREKLIELYGQEKGSKVKCAEAFEVCEYGRQPTAAELKQLFPFFER
ncbi:MAG: PIG-L family deacetylase [Phycisphaerales bacterium]|nr:MAG: PIG-L family deacetylase [Phycisphaerales bacterium]